MIFFGQTSAYRIFIHSFLNAGLYCRTFSQVTSKMYCLVKQSIILAKTFCQYGLNNFHFLCQLNQSFKLSGFLFKMVPGNKSFEESQLLCFVCLLLFKFPRHAVFSAAINNIFYKISNCYHCVVPENIQTPTTEGISFLH